MSHPDRMPPRRPHAAPPLLDALEDRLLMASQPGLDPADAPAWSSAAPAVQAAAQAGVDAPVREVALVNGYAKYADASGDLVHVYLVGGGTGTIYFDAEGNADAGGIYLSGTNERSLLVVINAGRTTIGGIESAGPIAGIYAQAADLTGLITVGPSTQAWATVTLALGRIKDAVIDSAMPVAALLATEWLDTDDAADMLQAPRATTVVSYGRFQADLVLGGTDAWGNSLTTFYSLGSVSGSDLVLAGGVQTLVAYGWTGGLLRADRVGTLYVVGDLTADLTFSDSDTWGRSVGVMLVTGAMSGSTLQAVGSIGTLSVGSLRDSRVLVSVRADLSDMPAPGQSDYFLPPLNAQRPAGIDVLVISNPAGRFENSIVSAPRMGTVVLWNALAGAEGRPFGLAVETAITVYVRYAGTRLAAYAINVASSLDSDAGFHVTVL